VRFGYAERRGGSPIRWFRPAAELPVGRGSVCGHRCWLDATDPLPQVLLRAYARQRWFGLAGRLQKHLINQQN
jgi:hypothetical protein